MWSFREWRRRRVLRRAALSNEQWERALRYVPIARRYDAGDRARLRDLAVLFLHEKHIVGAGGLVVDDTMRLVIAIQACIPILNLGLDYYAGWYSVIVYPTEFNPVREYEDEDGVVHTTDEPMSGESWQDGPVILSWDDVRSSGDADGFNLVIHEFAHKLDMLDGAPNGAPPLHKEMRRESWVRAFSVAYDEFCARVDAGQDVEIDPYAAEGPDEFFAVLSEAFFEIPEVVQRVYPDVYEQLRMFYRQDPINFSGSR